MARAQASQRANKGSYSKLALLESFARINRARLLWAAGVVVLVVLAVLAHSNAQFPGDAAISGLLRPLHHSFIAPVIEFPSDVNQPTVGAILFAVIVALLALLRHLREALAAVVGTLASDLINALMNGLVSRPRPNNIHVQTLSGLGSHSFPSGHVEHVTVLFGFLLYLTLLAIRAQPEHRTWLRATQVLCIYFIALIGVSRVVEEDHQPSDVLAGYLLAALMLPLVIAFYRWLGEVWQRHQGRKEGGQVATHSR